METEPNEVKRVRPNTAGLSEVSRKLLLIRTLLEREQLAAVRLRGVDWFSWVTAGGSNVVLLAAETGIAEVLVTNSRAVVITNVIESPRLRAEELPGEFEILTVPWQDPGAVDLELAHIIKRGLVSSDRPLTGEHPLPDELVRAKLVMQPEEIARYRLMASQAAEAMTEALTRAEPTWSENRLAGEGARELWERGIHPTLILVAGAERLEKHRHPFPTGSPLGERAMMVFCGRKWGLFANLTRLISFRQPNDREHERLRVVEEIEARAFAQSRPGQTLDQIYSIIQKSYADLGYPEQINQHHIGGLTGYLSREAFARPLHGGDAAIEIREGSALAWNPSLPGAKIEDTVYVGPLGRLEILTQDPRWPQHSVHGRLRPSVFVKV